jgi:hypothetical protein
MLEYGFCNPGHITLSSNLTGGVVLRSIDISVRARGGADAPRWLLAVQCDKLDGTGIAVLLDADVTSDAVLPALSSSTEL